MASGEMSEDEFRDFIETEMVRNLERAKPGAVIQSFIDWRGMEKVITAGTKLGLELINVIVWYKGHGSFGSPWRHHRILKRGNRIEDADEVGLNIAAQIIGAIAGCASISDAKPPTFFFALRKVGLLDAPLPRAMAINRFDRLGCYRAKPRAISGDRPPSGS